MFCDRNCGTTVATTVPLIMVGYRVANDLPVEPLSAGRLCAALAAGTGDPLCIRRSTAQAWFSCATPPGSCLVAGVAARTGQFPARAGCTQGAPTTASLPRTCYPGRCTATWFLSHSFRPRLDAAHRHPANHDAAPDCGGHRGSGSAQRCAATTSRYPTRYYLPSHHPLRCCHGAGWDDAIRCSVWRRPSMLSRATPCHCCMLLPRGAVLVARSHQHLRSCSTSAATMARGYQLVFVKDFAPTDLNSSANIWPDIQPDGIDVPTVGASGALETCRRSPRSVALASVRVCSPLPHLVTWDL